MRNIQQLICVNCSTNDEKNNPKSEDIELMSISEEYFDSEDAEFETYQCPRCNYKLWIRTNLK